MEKDLVSLDSLRKLVSHKLEEPYKVVESADGEFFGFVPKIANVTFLGFNYDSVESPLTCITEDGTNDYDNVALVLHKYELVEKDGEYLADLSTLLHNRIFDIRGETITSKDIPRLRELDNGKFNTDAKYYVKTNLGGDLLTIAEVIKPTGVGSIEVKPVETVKDWAVDMVAFQLFDVGVFSMLLQCYSLDGEEEFIQINSWDVGSKEDVIEPLKEDEPFIYFNKFAYNKLTENFR